MRGEPLPDFVQTAVKEIDEQLRVLNDEATRLEAAHGRELDRVRHLHVGLPLVHA